LVEAYNEQCIPCFEIIGYHILKHLHLYIKTTVLFKTVKADAETLELIYN